MIRLNDQYYITADGNGFALGERVVGTRQSNAKDGSYKKGDTYVRESAYKYSTTLEGIAKIAFNEIMREKIKNEEITTIGQLLDSLRQIKALIHEAITLINKS